MCSEFVICFFGCFSVLNQVSSGFLLHQHLVLITRHQGVNLLVGSSERSVGLLLDNEPTQQHVQSRLVSGTLNHSHTNH